jgi:serine/threonine protein kinase
LLDTDTAYTAHKEAYLKGVLHCDISPGNILIVDGGGLLIDWDMCKEKHGNEGQTGKYWTSRTVRVNSWCLDLIDAKLGPQGTWPFMAADLVVDEDHEVTQTFIHDLESAFYVLLYQAVRYRHTSLSKSKRSGLYSRIFYTRTFDGTDDGSKLSFMQNPLELDDFKVLDGSKGSCNQPFTRLIRDLKETLGQRHTLKYPERSAPSAFLDLDSKDYDALPYRHDDIINLFSHALESPGWPENDGAEKQSILNEDHAVSSRYTSTKRVLSAYEDDNPSTSSGHNLKRRR